MDGEEALDLLEDAHDRPRLIAGGAFFGVSVHRVADPDHLPALGLDGADQRRQQGFHLIRAHARNDRQPAGLVPGVEDVDEFQHLVGVG